MQASNHIFISIILSSLQGWSCIGQQSGSAAAPSNTVLDLVMPSVRPTEVDEYLCTAKKLADTELFITSFTALAEATRAHHILVFGCDEVASQEQSWHCGGVCKGGAPRILFAWAKNAPPTQLPPNVSFKVGPGTGASYLVLQVHYNNPVQANDKGDTSGIRMLISTQPPQFLAGILLFVSYRVTIPASTPKTHADISCVYNGDTVLYPFAYRVHSHSLGKVISAYHNNGSWYQIGKGNPQWPQAFYPIQGQMSIRPQETLAARCTYDSSDKATATHIGGKHTDEMCNFYMMYYTDYKQGQSFLECPGNNDPAAVATLPADSDVPLPPNPALEAAAQGHHDNHVDDHLGGDPSASYGNPRTGRYEDISRYNNRFINRPYDSYDYYSNLGGGADENGGRDYFYDEVANQRSRYRRPTQGRFDNDNDDSAGAFFGFSDNEDDGYYGQPRTQGRGQPAMSYSDRMNAYDLIRQPGVPAGRPGVPAGQPGVPAGQPQQPKAPSKPHAESMGPVPHQTTQNKLSKTFQPKISAKKGPLRPRPQPTRQVVTVIPHTTTPKAITSASTNPVPKNSMIEEVPNWPVIPPSLKLGQVAGLAVDTTDDIFVFHRGARTWNFDTFDQQNKFKHTEEGAIKEDVILQFDQLGELKAQWGKNMFFLPHGMHIDHEDSLWLTDVAMHQVFMYKKGAKTASLTLGTRMIPGTDSSHFCKPADVATTKSGFVFIADGYCNARIMKFTRDGKFVKQWGERTEPALHNGLPQDGTFNIPHSITVLEDHGWVCVADRENGRIQCFDFEGKFIKNIHLEGFHSELFAVSYSEKDKVLYAVNGKNALGSVAVQGFVVSPDTGTLITTFVPDSPSGFSTPHDICVSNKGDQVFVGEIGPNKIWDFKVHQDRLTEKLVVVKKPRPTAVSVGSEVKSDNQDNLDDIPGDFGASIVIGLLLIVPIIIIVSITVFLRLKKKGKIPFLSNYNSRNRRFNLGDFFSRHNGFDRVKTEDGDELDHLNSDSDVEEYSATAQKA